MDESSISFIDIPEEWFPFRKAGWLVYDWEYARTGDLTKRYKGSVTHLPSNGAEELVAKVMTKIKTVLRKT